MLFLFGRQLSGYGRFGRLVNCVLLTGVIATAAPAGAAPVSILALGDSITAGLGLPPDESLPAKLEERLKADGFDATIINAGVSGDTTAGGLARLDWVMADHPPFVLVELGANDALRGLDPSEARDNLDKILARLAAEHVKVLLIGMMAPGNWGHAYAQKFDAIYPDLAAKYHVPLYPFILDGVALDPKLNQGDGLHPNVAGVAVIVEKLAPAVEALLKSSAAGQG
ncbi:MAG TPA: arylesterase [Stellaceae bacterium]|nr:arylesterase [Stellaceae bacterium]